MKVYMARLGSFMFGLDTAAFTQLQRVSGYKWEEKNRIGRDPALQFTGTETETITLSGVIYPHYRGGLQQMEQLRQQADRGLPLPFIYASEYAGQYLGRWCVSGITEDRTVFFEDGRPRRIEFQVSLKRYGEDGTGGPLPNAILGAATLLGGGVSL